MYLEKIHSPADLRALDTDQLKILSEEIRSFIVQAVARTGGHLGSNLGDVELTLAVHRVFESPRDLIVWDTGHQAYTHKIVTGRRDRFDQLRQRDGLSGYPSRSESAHDIVENSHASTSLSWLHGLRTALDLRGEDHRTVVAIIGDGSMTGGMAFEALNNLGHSQRRAVIILNDNGRSYAPTVSRLTTSLASLRLHPNFVRNRNRLYELLRRVPMGSEFKRGLEGAKAAVREIWEPPAFFETLGVRYTGPFDGHDIPCLEQALRHAADFDGPIVVHVLTEKGHGYKPAEDHGESHLHDTGLFDPAIGPVRSTSPAPEYKVAFVDALLEAGERHPDLVALTAAMPGSTGVLAFAERFPERAFDVGIAEQHMLTMAAGLATAGAHPVVAVYSTFLSRAFDQLVYDIAMHRLPVVLCIDRAGITGPDGASHHGVYDMALALRVPNMTVFAPSSFQELPVMFREALRISDGPVSIRWPRGPAAQVEPHEVGHGLNARQVRSGTDICLIGVGRLLPATVRAAQQLEEEGFSVTVWDPRVVRPLDATMLRSAVRHRVVVTAEDGVRDGGVGDRIAADLATRAGGNPSVIVLGTPTEFLPFGDPEGILADLGLDAAGIAAAAGKAMRQLDRA